MAKFVFDKTFYTSIIFFKKTYFFKNRIQFFYITIYNFCGIVLLNVKQKQKYEQKIDRNLGGPKRSSPDEVKITKQKRKAKGNKK